MMISPLFYTLRFVLFLLLFLTVHDDSDDDELRSFYLMVNYLIIFSSLGFWGVRVNERFFVSLYFYFLPLHCINLYHSYLLHFLHFKKAVGDIEWGYFLLIFRWIFFLLFSPQNGVSCLIRIILS